MSIKEQEDIKNALHCAKFGAEIEVCENCNLYPCDHSDVSDLSRVVVDALEKKIIKKVINPQKSESVEDIEYAGEHTLYGNCPNCGELLCSLWNTTYCGDCGQKIEWE